MRLDQAKASASTRLAKPDKATRRRSWQGSLWPLLGTALSFSSLNLSAAAEHLVTKTTTDGAFQVDISVLGNRMDEAQCVIQMTLEDWIGSIDSVVVDSSLGISFIKMGGSASVPTSVDNSCYIDSASINWSSLDTTSDLASTSNMEVRYNLYGIISIDFLSGSAQTVGFSDSQCGPSQGSFTTTLTFPLTVGMRYNNGSPVEWIPYSINGVAETSVYSTKDCMLNYQLTPLTETNLKMLGTDGNAISKLATGDPKFTIEEFGFYYKDFAFLHFDQTQIVTSIVDSLPTSFALQAVNYGPNISSLTWSVVSDPANPTSSSEATLDVQIDTSSNLAPPNMYVPDLSDFADGLYLFKITASSTDPARSTTYTVSLDVANSVCLTQSITVVPTGPADYDYNLTGASWTPDFTSSNPGDCPITYSCSQVSGVGSDLCSTPGVFDTATGTLSLNSQDMVAFPPGAYLVSITGILDGLESTQQTYSYTITLVDPCTMATFESAAPPPFADINIVLGQTEIQTLPVAPASVTSPTWVDCGSILYTWKFQAADGSGSVQTSDAVTFDSGTLALTIQAATTADRFWIGDYILTFEAELVTYSATVPTLTAQPAFALTIIDNCSSAAGFTLEQTIIVNEGFTYRKSSRNRYIRNAFVLSDTSCSHQYQQTCSLDINGVTYEDCDTYVSYYRTNFQCLIVQLSNDVDGLFTVGSHLVTVTGTVNDVVQTGSFFLDVYCSLIVDDLQWTTDESFDREFIRKDYNPSWVFSPTYQIDPIRPDYSSNPLDSLDPTCPISGTISWTSVDEVRDAFGASQSSDSVEIDAGFTNSAVAVRDLSVGWTQYIQFQPDFNNLRADDNGLLPFIDRTILFVDGLTLVSVRDYAQQALTIDLESGSASLDLLVPIFIDETASETLIKDPETNPVRSIYFKIKGDSSADPSDFFSLTVTDNSDLSQVSVQLAKVEALVSNIFQLVTCYAYDGYANLADLCDTANAHTVINARGTCFDEFSLVHDDHQVNSLQAIAFSAVIGLETESVPLFSLSDIAALAGFDPVSPCGTLGFKLTDEAAHGALLSVAVDGSVSLLPVTDTSLAGTYQVGFQGFLSDVDPDALWPQALDLTIKVELVEPVAQDEEFLAQVASTLLRQAPISLKPIAPLYFAFAKSPQSFIFEFADPLAVALHNGEEVADSSLSLAGIQIKMTQNEIPSLIQLAEIDYSDGVGFARVTLALDGDAALEQLLRSQVISGESQSEKSRLEGAVTLEVTELSTAGLSSLFQVNFLVTLEPQIIDQTLTSDSSQTAAEQARFNSNVSQAETTEELLAEASLIKYSLKLKYEGLEVDEPKVIMKAVTQAGLVDIQFSNLMAVPQTDTSPSGKRLLQDQTSEEDESKSELRFTETLRLEDMIEVSLISGEDTEGWGENVSIPNRDFEWSISNYSSEYMQIQLDFKDPKQISSAQEMDKVRVKFVDTRLIYDFTGQEVTNGTFVEHNVPTQFTSEAEQRVFTAIEEVFETVDTGAFSSDVVINTIIAGSLNQLWVLVPSQQIIIMLPLFNVALPANAEVIMGILLHIAAFEMVPTDKIYSEMIERLAEVHHDRDELNEKMETLGFESTWLVPNLGSLLLFAGLYPLMLALLLALNLLIFACPCCGCLKGRRESLRLTVFWKWPISFLRDSYIVLCICAIYNISYASWQNRAAQLNSAFSWALLALLILYPALMQAFLYKKRLSLRKDAFQKKFGDAYSGLDEKESKFLLYPLFFYYRRILVPLTVIIFPSMIIVQYFTLTMSGVATIILIGMKQPFKSKLRNNTEIMEESAIIIIMYHIFCFTDWLADLNVRHALGYSLIACILLHLLIFLGASLFLALRASYRGCKRGKILARAHKHRLRQHKKLKPAFRRTAKMLAAKQLAWGEELEEHAIREMEEVLESEELEELEEVKESQESEESEESEEPERKAAEQTPPQEFTVTQKREPYEGHLNIPLKAGELNQTSQKKTEVAQEQYQWTYQSVLADFHLDNALAKANNVTKDQQSQSVVALPEESEEQYAAAPMTKEELETLDFLENRKVGERPIQGTSLPHLSSTSQTYDRDPYQSSSQAVSQNAIRPIYISNHFDEQPYRQGNLDAIKRRQLKFQSSIMGLSRDQNLH